MESVSVCVPVSTFMILQQLGHMYFRVGLVLQLLLVLLFFVFIAVTPIIGWVWCLIGVPGIEGNCVAAWVFWTFLLVIVMLLMFDDVCCVFRKNQSVFRLEDFERFRRDRDGESFGRGVL